MGSSEDLIERAVVGTMAIAWFEHEQRCQREAVEPTTRGFSGSFEVLAQMFAPTDRFTQEEAGNSQRRRVRPNRWHQAAGRACQRLPNLDQVADTLLYEIPRQARDNLADIAKRMEAPANKIRPLVGAAASVRRFVGHPERLSLRSVIEAHDTLIVNPRIELIGEDQASILTNFIVHMLDLQLKRQVATPRARRPRVSLIIDEAHRLITATLMTMIATHREAGLTVAAAVQYVSQLGADEPSAARREKILKGVGNLLQTKVLFRMSDTDDADRHSQIFRSVYETMVRADPTSRARMPFDPARMQTLRDHHALVSLVSTADAANGDGLVDGGHGATRLPAFVTQTYAMPDVDEIPDRWRERAPRPPARRVHPLPGGHERPRRRRRSGRARRRQRRRPRRRREARAGDARTVAEETVGRRPEGALRDTPPRKTAASAPSAEPNADARRREPADYDPGLFETAGGRDAERRAGQPGLRRPPLRSRTAARGRAAGWERVGGVRIERAEEPAAADDHALVADSPVLRAACLPTSRPLPQGDLPPATASARRAVRDAATFEAIARLPEFGIAGGEARSVAARAASVTREQALAEAEATGLAEQERHRHAERRARRAAADVLARYGNLPWRTPIKQIELAEADAHTLEVIARLRARLARHPHRAAGRAGAGARRPRPPRPPLRRRPDRAQRGRDRRPPRPAPAALRGRPARARIPAPAPQRPAPRPGPARLPERRAQAPRRRQGPRRAARARRPADRRRAAPVRRPRCTGTRRGCRAGAGTSAWSTRIAATAPSGSRTSRPRPGLSVHGEQLDAPPTLEPDLSVQLQGPARRRSAR